MYLVEIAISVFSGPEEKDIFIVPVFENFVQIALVHLNRVYVDQYKYLTDDFLGMNLRLLLKHPEILIESPSFP